MKSAQENGWDYEKVAKEASRRSKRAIISTLAVAKSRLLDYHVVPPPKGEKRVPMSCKINRRELFEINSNCTMGDWITILEAEGLDRGILPCRVNMSSGRPVVEKPRKTSKTTKTRRRATQNQGLTASQIPDDMLKKIFQCRNENNGKKLSWQKIEQKFDLRDANGMTARRAFFIYLKKKKALKKKTQAETKPKPQAKAKTAKKPASKKPKKTPKAKKQTTRAKRTEKEREALRARISKLRDEGLSWPKIDIQLGIGNVVSNGAIAYRLMHPRKKSKEKKE